MNLLKEHKIAVFSAVLIGVIMALPHIYFVFDNKEAYDGVFMGGLDEGPYLARMQEVRDGHVSMANPFWAEGKDKPYLWPPLPEIFASGFGMIFGLGIVNTVLFENFVFPLLLLLIIYSLAYQMSKNKLIGLISALAIMLMPNITDPKALGQLLFNQNVTNAFLAYSRLISPQVHSLFLFSFFLSFWMFLDKKKWVYGIVSGILSGLLFYTYPFAWMFVGSFFTFLLLIYIFRKKWIDIRNIFLISLVAFMVASPFLFNLIQAMNDPAYEDVSLRYGWVESRAPQIGVTVLVLLGIFLLFFPKKEKKIYDFSLSIVLAPLILLNQQVITGYLLGPARYHHYYYKPFAVVFLFIILYSFLKKPLFKVLVVLVLLIGFYNAYLVQTFSYKTYESLGIENQRYGTVFNWLNENGNKDESVVANPYLSDLIPIYTSLNVPLNLDAHYSLTSNEDLLERMFFSYRLNNVGGENIKETFYQNRERISKDIFAQRHHKEFGSYEAIPDEQLDLFIKGYGRSLEIPTEDMFEKLKVDYVVWDTKSDPIWNIDQYPFLNLVYEDKGFKIYEFNQR